MKKYLLSAFILLILAINVYAGKRTYDIRITDPNSVSRYMKITNVDGTTTFEADDPNDIVDFNTKFDIDYVESATAANETRYFDSLTTISTDPAGNAEVSGGYFRVSKTGGSNGVYTINGLEGVAGSSYADEAGTFRGVYGRTYTNADATSTMRTAIGGEFSARASYSGGTECVAESGTAFVGTRIWMAPYFTSGSVGNLNNFWGLWIYGEHTTQRNADAAIKISDAGGGFTDDIILQGGNKITNETAETITIDAGLTIGDATTDTTTINSTITSNQTHSSATTPFYFRTSLSATSGEHNNLRARAQSTAESASTSDIRGVYGQGIANEGKYAGAITGVFANAIAKNTSTSTHVRGLFAEAESEATPTAITNLYGAYIRTKMHVDPATDAYGVMIDNEKMATGFLTDAYLGMKSSSWGAAESSSAYGIDMNGITKLSTADLRLHNGALLNNSTADLLTITEATVDIDGAATAGSVTSDTTVVATSTMSTGANGGTSGQITFIASDNDQGTMTITTDDELMFEGFSGGYSMGDPLKIDANNYTIDIDGTTFNANLISNSESITDLTSIWQSNTDTAIVSGNMIFARSRGTEGSQDAVINGDELGMIIFCGYDGTDYNFSAGIQADVMETTVASDEMGGRLVLSTAAEGTNDLLDRLIIQNTGDIRISKTSNAGIVDTTSIAELQFWGDDDTASADEIAGQIEVIATGTWTDVAEDAKMVLNVANDGVLNANQLVLNTDGTVSMGGGLGISGGLTVTLGATDTFLVEGDTTRTGTNPVVDIDATIDTTTATDDVVIQDMDISRAAADTGGTRGMDITITSGAMANSEDSYGIAIIPTLSAADTATSTFEAFKAANLTTDGDSCTAYGLYVGTAYDYSLYSAAGEIDFLFGADEGLLIDGTTTDQTGATSLVDIDMGGDTDDTDDQIAMDIDVVRDSTTDTGGNTGVDVMVTTCNMANAEVSAAYTADGDCSAATTATSAFRGFLAAAPTDGQANCVSSAFYVANGWDYGLFIEGDDVCLGTSTTASNITMHDASTITMYDDGDNTNVVIGPVADGTDDLGITGDLVVSKTISANGAVLTGDTNTFDITSGTGSLNVAAGKTVDFDMDFKVDGTGTTITGVTQANTLTLNESFTIGDGYNVSITAEDVAGSIVLDEQTFEVEGEGTATRLFKLVNAEDAARTLTFNENITIGDGYSITFTAEDAISSITLDEQTFEVEGEGTATQLMKLVNANNAAATLTIEGTSAVVNQDTTSDGSPSFTKVTTTEIDFAGNIILDPTVDGASYVDIANSGTGSAKLYIEGDQINSDDLSDVASVGMLDEAETVSGAWVFSNQTTALTIGDGTDTVDFRILANGHFADGSITYMEDEDRWDFDNDVDVIGDLTAGTGSFDGAISGTGATLTGGTLAVGADDTTDAIINLYGDNGTVGPTVLFHNAASEDTTEEYWIMEPQGTNFHFGAISDADQFIFSNAGNFTASGNVAGATFGSDASISNAELLGIDDGATTEIPVGGGAGSAMVWTTATGTGAPVRAGSPIFTTQITTPKVTNAAALTLESTGAGVNVNIHSDATDDFTVGTSMLVVEGDTGNVGIGTTAPNCNLEIYADTVANLYLRRSNTGEAPNGVIYFNGDSSGSVTYGSSIQGYDGSLKFFTDSTPRDASNDLTQMAIITNTGDVGIGATSPDGPFHVEEDNAATAAAVEVMRVSLTSTGTPAVGLGPAIVGEVETVVGVPGNQEEIGSVDFIVTDVGSGTEDGAIILKSMTGGATRTEKMRIGADNVNVSAPLFEKYNITTDNTDGAATHTAAELLGKHIRRGTGDELTAARTDVTDTAANIVAAMNGCVDGNGFEFTIANEDSTHTVALDGGAGVTIIPNDPSTAIPANSTARFKLVVTDATPSSEAVDIHCLGYSTH